jgi:hypothetical protein
MIYFKLKYNLNESYFVIILHYFRKSLFNYIKIYYVKQSCNKCISFCNDNLIFYNIKYTNYISFYRKIKDKLKIENIFIFIQNYILQFINHFIKRY